MSSTGVTTTPDDAEALRGMTEQRLVGICEMSLDGRLLSANRKMRALLRLPTAVPAEMPLRELVLASDEPSLDAAFAALLRGDGVDTMEIRLPHPDGGITWIAATIDLVRSPEGLPWHYLMAASDVTAAKHGEDLLRRSEECLRLALDSARLGALHWNLVTGDVDCSAMALAHFGLAAGMHPDAGQVLAALSPEDGHALRSLLRQLERAAGDINLELRIPWPDGTMHWIALQGRTNSGQEGIPWRLECVTADITERKAREETEHRIRDRLAARAHEVETLNAELTASLAQTAAANRAMSTFLATMSHELRTPMSVIMGAADLLRRRTNDIGSLELLASLGGTSTLLLALLNDILDLSKIESGQFTLEDAPFRPGEVIARTVATLRPLALAKGLALSADTAPALETMTLRGDPLRLGQILLNLLGNAIKFTRAGTVSVSARVAGDTGGGVVLRFEVRDTGIGIAAEARDRLFNAFVQADPSTTRQFGGSGLGLAISKRLAEKMGGEIGIAEGQDQGATVWFTICLPRTDPIAASQCGESAMSVQAALLARHPGARVLVVEDTPMIREIVAMVLREAGLVVDEAADGIEAVEFARSSQYSLILMDMRMPRMDGLEATRAIRALPSCIAVPIVALTANAFTEDRDHCLQAGMNDHLSKPVLPEVLLAKVLQWLEPVGAAIGAV